MSSLYQIEKLDETNYDSWCIHMKSVLIHGGMWGIVNGTTSKEATDTDGKWEKSDEKALATILLCVKASQLNHIKNVKTSIEAWETLQEIFRPSGPVKKVSLYKQLLNLRMTDENNMSQHVNAFATIVDKLAEVGIDMNNELLAIILLSSLPPTYEQFVVAMETRDSLPSLQNLKIKILEEADRKVQNESASTSQQAFMARSRHSTKPGRGNKTINSRHGKQNKKLNGNCFTCGKFGHFAIDCYTNKQGNKNATTSFAVLAATDACALSTSSWCIDSGATAHMCGNRDSFTTFRQYSDKISLASNNNFITAEGIGDVEIKTSNDSLILKNVLFVPKLIGNFLSVSRAIEGGCVVKFYDRCAEIKDEKGCVVLRAKKENKLFVFENHNDRIMYMARDEAMLWHSRYGHLNFNSLRQLKNKEMVNGLDRVAFGDQIKCDTCMKSKIHVKPFKSTSGEVSSNVIDLIHTDVCGPFSTTSLGGSRYFLTFIDDCSRRMFVYFLKSKDEVFDKFVEFKNMVERQTERNIKSIRSDNGKEFVNKRFDKYLAEYGITRQLTVPYTPQQNGVAERANRTLVEMARSMLVQSGMGEFLWAEAIATAVYIRNRSPTKIIAEKTPYEVWTSRQPHVSHLRIFGAKAVALDKTQRKKFRPKGKQYIMVGYSITSKAYRLYDPQSRQVVEKRDVWFDEEDLLHGQCQYVSVQPNESSTSKVVAEIEEEQVSQGEEENVEESAEEGSSYESLEELDEDQQLPVVGPGRPKLLRTGRPGRPRKQYNLLNALQDVDIEIPNTIREATNSDYSDEWKDAMQAEYKSLIANKTWSLANLPKGQKAIGNKWVFNIKRNQDGSIEKFKARLVAKGCSQQYGINYTETFSPVVRYATMRMLLALAVEHKLYLHQMDVCTAYLNGELKECVYMKQPENFIDAKHPQKVLKLHKSLYGLKQSGREWNSKLDEVLRSIGFEPCNSEPCLYKQKECMYNFIAVYVDDLIIGSKKKEDLIKIKSKIMNAFECVDKGQLHYFLGMQINRDGELGAISLSQSQYIEDLLKQHNMENCRPASTPLDAGFQIACEKENCPKVDVTEYQSIIGVLTYLAISSRPDILHSVSKLAQRNKDPHKEHVAGIKHILRYLSATKDLKMTYRHTGNPIEGYADADWGGDATDRKSYTGYVFYMGGCAFSWESKKQQSVALSSTEAEYVALSTAAKEAMYLRTLLKEIGLQNEVGPTTIYSDNLGAQQLAKHHKYHARSKHIEIKHHYVRDLIKEGCINVNYISTNDMRADVLTKNLVKIKHEKLVNLIGLN